MAKQNQTEILGYKVAKPEVNPLWAYWMYLADKEPRAAFARRAGYKTESIEAHLLSNPPNRTPKPKSLKRIAEASKGHLSFEELMAFFRPNTPLDDVEDWDL
jgi:hypothetical protein